MSLLFLITRSIMEFCVFKPFGRWLGLKNRPRVQPPRNPLLQMAASSGQLEEAEVVALASKVGMSYLQVERWLRQRRRALLPNTLSKFCETAWR